MEWRSWQRKGIFHQWLSVMASLWRVFNGKDWICLDYFFFFIFILPTLFFSSISTLERLNCSYSLELEDTLMSTRLAQTLPATTRQEALPTALHTTRHVTWRSKSNFAAERRWSMSLISRHTSWYPVWLRTWFLRFPKKHHLIKIALTRLFWPTFPSLVTQYPSNRHHFTPSTCGVNDFAIAQQQDAPCITTPKQERTARITITYFYSNLKLLPLVLVLRSISANVMWRILSPQHINAFIWAKKKIFLQFKWNNNKKMKRRLHQRQLHPLNQSSSLLFVQFDGLWEK